jgi:hypothetical protein
VLDASFNVNNFGCLDMAQDDPARALAFECSLSGSTNLTKHARQLSSGRQTPHSIPGLSGSVSASPTSLTPKTTNEHSLGIFAPISEMACTSAGGPCYGENGEVGFSVRKGACSKSQGKKKTYWLNDATASMASFNAQCSAAGETTYECAKVGFRSFDPIVEQGCSATNDELTMPSIQEKTCNKNGDAIADIGDFQFPSWDQLPEDFQNPTTSADFHSTIPISTAAGVENGTTTSMAWDNDEMNFTMDMDMELDLDLNVFGKC